MSFIADISDFDSIFEIDIEDGKKFCSCFNENYKYIKNKPILYKKNEVHNGYIPSQLYHIIFEHQRSLVENRDFSKYSDIQQHVNRTYDNYTFIKNVDKIVSRCLFDNELHFIVKVVNRNIKLIYGSYWIDCGVTFNNNICMHDLQFVLKQKQEFYSEEHNKYYLNELEKGWLETGGQKPQLLKVLKEAKVDINIELSPREIGRRLCLQYIYHIKIQDRPTNMKNEKNRILALRKALRSIPAFSHKNPILTTTGKQAILGEKYYMSKFVPKGVVDVNTLQTFFNNWKAYASTHSDFEHMKHLPGDGFVNDLYIFDVWLKEECIQVDPNYPDIEGYNNTFGRWRPHEFCIK
ncbi:MAG: hypothetical protein R3Y11_06690 [Pseudomonadota bacterium]